jgi:hypothetical protein
MKLRKIIKKLWRFAVGNYFVSIFFACIVFVVFVSAYKLFFTKPTFIYVKVKMGQGLWWASTGKTPIWFIKGLKKGDVEKDLIGNSSAEILSVRYYPWTYNQNQYDVYVDLKLKVTGDKKTGKYNFNRSTIGVGVPIDLEFPSSQFSGTIIDISEKPFKKKYIEKIVSLIKASGYNKDFPFPYENIVIGDKYFDGEDYVFEVLDKKLQKQIWTVTNNLTGQLYEREVETSQGIIIKAKIKVKEVDKYLVYGEDQIVSLNRNLNISTSRAYGDYTIIGIE